jgi:hypothetical protein
MIHFLEGLVTGFVLAIWVAVLFVYWALWRIDHGDRKDRERRMAREKVI